ncbi:MAG: hypothetical protein HY553_06465 [Elusimicrobia bacterium]|nr:hypothetical protein [Elusimicrobiota bacterium]
MRPRAYWLAALAFAAYTSALSGAFLMDDFTYIVRNPANADPAQWLRFLYDPASVVAHETMSAHAYRPLVGLVYGATRLAAGLNPFWFHLVSLCLHALNTVLVFRLASRFASGLAPWAGAALFCLHPVQAEAVSYIGAQPDLLVTCFCLVVFLAYSSEGYERKAGLRWGACAAFAAALLSKETALFWLLAAPCYDHVARRAWTRERRLRAWLPFAALGLAYLVARAAVLGRVSHEGRPWGGGWPMHAVTVAHAAFQYLANVAWPLELRACYNFEVGPRFAAWAALKAAVTLAVVAVAARALWRRAPAGFFGAWAAAAILPASNVLPLVVLGADRFLYAAMAGMAGAWALWVARWPRRWGAAAVAAISACLWALSADQQLNWQNDVELFTHAYARAPRDPCTHVSLSNYYIQWRMYDRAEALNEAVVRSPLLRERGLRKLGEIRLLQGRPAEAVRAFEEALSVNPALVGVHRALAVCATVLGDPDRAARERELEKTVRRARGLSP